MYLEKKVARKKTRLTASIAMGLDGNMKIIFNECIDTNVNKSWLLGCGKN